LLLAFGGLSGAEVCIHFHYFIFDSVLFSQRRINVNLVDLVKSFPTKDPSFQRVSSIYSQKSSSIQPRTSLSKFGGGSIRLLISILSSQLKLSSKSSDLSVCDPTLTARCGDTTADRPRCGQPTVVPLLYSRKDPLLERIAKREKKEGRTRTEKETEKEGRSNV